MYRITKVILKVLIFCFKSTLGASDAPGNSNTNSALIQQLSLQSICSLVRSSWPNDDKIAEALDLCYLSNEVSSNQVKLMLSVQLPLEMLQNLCQYMLWKASISDGEGEEEEKNDEKDELASIRNVALMALLSAREDEEDLVFSCDSDQVLSTSLRILQLVSQSFMDLSRSTTLVKEPLNPDLLTLLHRHVASFVGLIKYGAMILRPQLCRSYPPSTTTTPDKPSASSAPSCKSKDRSASSTFLQSMLCLAEETLLVWSQYRTHAGEDALSIVETSLLGALWWSPSQLYLFATPSSLLFSEATATLPPTTIEAMRFLTCFLF